MAGTVTVTPGGASFQHGIGLLVRVLTGGSEATGATSGSNSTGGATAQGSLTPNANGSWVMFAISGDNVTSMPAAASNNTYDISNSDPSDLWASAFGHYTGTVTAGTPLTYGAGSAGAQDHSNWCAYEVPGGTVDASSPTGVFSTTSTTNVTTGSFTPPAGSVLVAMVQCGCTGSGAGATFTMSDTLGGLTWTPRAVSSTSDNFQPTAIFTATVPTGTGPAPGRQQQARARFARMRHGKRTERQQPWLVVPTPPITINATASLSGQGSLSISIPRYIAALAGSGYNSYFTDQFGTPKLMLLEQAWALPWNAGRWSGSGGGATPQADYTSYFSTRAAQGYTSWYGIAWGNSHVDSTALSGGRTWDGIYPLIVNGTAGAISTGSETISLNSSFWSRIDAFFNTALQYGITCFLNLSMSYDVTDVGGIWQHATNTQAGAFGAALAARYPQASFPNVQWFWGDDDDGPNDSFYQAMLTGIQGAGDTRSLISIEQFTNTNCHIEFDNKTGFSGTFGKPNATYNWGYCYDASYFGIEDSYTEGGTFTHIPPIYGDGFYYGDTGSGTNTDRLMRTAAWWAISSGARGIPATSGPSDLGGGGLWTWQSDAVSRLTSDPNGNGTFTTTVAGAIRAFIEGLTDWQKLIPDTGNVLITAGRGTRGTCDAAGGVFNFRNTNNYVTGSITPTGTLAVIYCKAAMSITIDQTQMGAGYTATWVDPLSLATTPTTTGTTYSSSGLGNNSAGDPDWVLVLQAPPVVSGTASITGSGSVSAVVTEQVTAPLAGSGSLTAAVVQQATAPITGAGTLTPAVVQQAVAAPTGSGSLTAAVVQQATAPLTGTGTLSAASGGGATGAASITGTGSLAAVVIQQATAALTGTGSLTPNATQQAGATIAGTGSLTAAVVQQATAATTGLGSLTALVTQQVITALTGTGTLSAASGAFTNGTASLTGAGTLSATGAIAGSATASLTGQGALAAVAVQRVTASITGSGSLTPNATQRTIAALAAAGSLTAAGTQHGPVVKATLTVAVTDPRDGTATVTTAAATASVTDPRDGTAGVS